MIDFLQFLVIITFVIRNGRPKMVKRYSIKNLTGQQATMVELGLNELKERWIREGKTPLGGMRRLDDVIAKAQQANSEPVRGELSK